jgi:hypothetical protein
MPTKRRKPPSIAPAPRNVSRPPIGCIDGDALAAQQGVAPVQDFQRFLDEIGDAWPEGESVDEFIAAIRERRRQGTRGGTG